MTRDARHLTPDETQRWSQIGALAAVALVLGYLETFIPIPIPGIKLGLANVSVLIALAQGDAVGACWIGVVKVLAAGLLFGNPVTMAYSALGTALALAIMVPLSRLRTMQLWMVSVVGAMAHVVGQLLVAQALLGTSLVWYSAGPLLLAACATGLLCGVVAVRACQLIEENGSSDGVTSELGDETDALAQREPFRRVDPRLALVMLVIFAVVVLRTADIGALLVCLALSAAACVYAHVGWQDLARALRPVALILCITIVAQLLTSHGQLASAAASVTTSALRLLSLVGASLAFVRVQSTEDLMQGLSWMLSPLRRLGFSTEGPLLALDVALRLLPQLASGLSFDQSRRLVDALPQLVAEAWRRASTLA